MFSLSSPPPSFLISSLQCIQVWRCGKHLCWIRHYWAFLRTTKVEAQFKWKKGLVVLLHSEFYTEDPLQGWPQHHFFFQRIYIADQAGSQNITLPYSCHAFKEIFYWWQENTLWKFSKIRCYLIYQFYRFGSNSLMNTSHFFVYQYWF